MLRLILMIIVSSCDTQRSRNTSQKIHVGRPRVGNDERGLGLLRRWDLSSKMLYKKKNIEIPKRVSQHDKRVYRGYVMLFPSKLEGDKTVCFSRALTGAITIGRWETRTTPLPERLTRLYWGCPFFSRPARDFRISPTPSDSAHSPTIITHFRRARRWSWWNHILQLNRSFCSTMPLMSLRNDILLPSQERKLCYPISLNVPIFIVHLFIIYLFIK